MENLTNTDLEKLLSDNDFFVLYLSAPWCGPCKTFSPVMEELSKELPIYKVDASTEREIAVKYGVRSVPTTVVVKNGEEVAKKVGVSSKDEISQWIQSNK